ncbi:hypothetical protein KQ51_01473 [Candidatus Izimaplasma bacterium HR1]|jgi:hypothetical protein|uniref:hypothetical protein n=1 Tax=Candidatus Izimoplasma sp. HR1 TaxID=1541959 RepID=UPI0004F6E9AD|nr:hypothetical protein KQ51_01473 [Candidatus Izimaplasma bacterium HR1]
MNKVSKVVIGNVILFGLFSIIGLVVELSTGNYEIKFLFNMKIETSYESLLYVTILVGVLTIVIKYLKSLTISE